jgi:hypothetical protein
MAKKAAPATAPDREPDPLAQAVDRLTAELSVFRQVIDEIREDFSWVTRNGLPVRPLEHVHVKRMALNPCAEDWGDRLEIERSTYLPRGSASPLESNTLDDVVDDLKATMEAAAQGQLEIVLTALDGVRAEILGALRRRHPDTPATSSGTRSSASSSSSPSSPSSRSSSPSSAPSSSPPADIPVPKPPPGQLF